MTDRGGAASDGRARRLPADRPRRGRPSATRPSARTTTTSSSSRCPVAELRDQGARCMECGVPFCHNGCPLGNLIPDWNDLVYRDRWRGRDRAAARDQQLPRVHRPAVPGAVRGGLRARDPRGRRGHDQADRELDHQPRLGGGLGRAAARRGARPAAAVAVVGSGPGGHGRRAAAAPRRPRRDALRARRGDRRPGALRRAGLQDREDGRRAARRAARRPRASSSAAASTSASTSTPTSCASAFDAVVLATGSRVPRDLPVPGRELDGVHFAMDYLYQRKPRAARPGTRAAGATDHAPRASTSS